MEILLGLGNPLSLGKIQKRNHRRFFFYFQQKLSKTSTVPNVPRPIESIENWVLKMCHFNNKRMKQQWTDCLNWIKEMCQTVLQAIRWTHKASTHARNSIFGLNDTVAPKWNHSNNWHIVFALWMMLQITLDNQR